ncbi:TPA: hypothetical protein QDB08_004492 [Burkholderia vietnamiensis]|uniref:hypothetical protein n=1 Tax=Burkholderia vietnamiensis TaxID=60552 RepID=UPI001592B324|nr:hypothetical protein [Burkholderia vietnamiensis]HDR9011484.1 hypothetical protein [Burkholderia vietnamiensis]HDR9016616.1 hypothetical protein [Burkholderia vietnamiensis]
MEIQIGKQIDSGTIGVSVDPLVVAAIHARCERIVWHGIGMGLVDAAALLAFNTALPVPEAKKRLDELASINH